MALDPQLKRLISDTVLQLGNQARLAEHLDVNPATISRWIADAQGMEVGSCLALANLTGTPPADVLRWAGYDPSRYLGAGAFVLSDEALEIADRARLLEWERARREIPARFRSSADHTVETILRTFREACTADATT